MKNIPPLAMANMANLEINLYIYCDKGDGYYDAVAANVAICPIKVLSPVSMTTPLPLPYLFNVENHATFLVSNTLSGCEH